MLGMAPNDTWRQRQVVDSRSGAYISLNKNKYCNFTSNDYLNLSQHAQVKQALVKAVHDYGLGSGASALVSGYSNAHLALEEAFAEFLGRDKTLLFNSGYHANLAVFQALANRHTYIFSDKYCHASLLDGIQLSRAQHIRFPHQDSVSAQSYLQQYPTQKKILITESIFGMEGSLTDLPSFADLCQETQTFFFVDDAHGLGVLGATGRGACEHFNLSQRKVPVLIQPLGKALGSMGAIVSGSDALIEDLIQRGRSYRYSTALPPAVVAASLAALRVLIHEPWRRTALYNHIVLFNQLAQKYQLPLFSTDITPIRSILVGSNSKTLHLQQLLQQRGHYVACIRPTTVPKNTARLRISLCSEHRTENIVRLLEDLADVF